MDANEFDRKYGNLPDVPLSGIGIVPPAGLYQKYEDKTRAFWNEEVEKAYTASKETPKEFVVDPTSRPSYLLLRAELETRLSEIYETVLIDDFLTTLLGPGMCDLLTDAIQESQMSEDRPPWE